MPDFRINQSTPTLPTPQAQPNAIDALNAGLQNGSSLGFKAKAMAIEQQRNDQLAKQADQEQKDKDFNAFTNSIQAIHKLPGSIRSEYWDGIVVPQAQKLGLPLSPGWDAKTDDPVLEEANQLIDAHLKHPDKVKAEDVMGGLHLLALKASKSGDEGNQKTLMDLAREYKSSSGQAGKTVTPDVAELISGVKKENWIQKYPDGDIPLSVARAATTVSLRTNIPTTNMRNMGEVAGTLLPHITEMRGLIAQANEKGYIGPTAGRVYGNFLAGKVGSTGNKDADRLLGKLNAENSLVNTAMARTHFGARGGQQTIGKFNELLNTNKQTAEVLNGALDTFESFVKGYKEAGGVGGQDGGAADPNDLSTLSDEDLLNLANGNK